MQFLIDDDGKNFEPYAMKCNDMTSNTLTMAAILYRVFDSYIDKHNLTVEDDEDSYFDSPFKSAFVSFCVSLSGKIYSPGS